MRRRSHRPPGDQPPPEAADALRVARADPTLARLEGLHPLKHALRFGAEVLGAVSAAPEEVLRLAEDLAPDIVETLAALLERVEQDVFAALSPSPPPSPVLAFARRPVVDARALVAGPAAGGRARAAGGPDAAPVVLLEEPTHPGNVGAVIRVAAAAGAAGVLTTGVHDPWQPAALRGSAGLHFALPVARIESLPPTNRPLVVVDPEGEPLGATVLPPGAILAFGSERRGLSAGLRDRADARVAIPMRAGVSSLNLSTAVAVVLYCGAGLQGGNFERAL